MQLKLGKYYISVTGLLGNGWLSLPKFFCRATQAYHDALKAEGNVYSSMFTRDGIHHTITVWGSKEDMQEFMRGEAHSRAMKSLSEVSRYVKVHGYFADEIPTVLEAIKKWKNEGRRVYGSPQEKCGDDVPKPKSCWECEPFEQLYA